MSVSTARPAAGRQGNSPPPHERILAAARELFYRRGIHGVDAIAEAAGTNKMTLYRHFASKDVLIAACLSELTQEFDAAWDVIADVSGGDRIPGCVEFPREFAETRGDQHILRREVAIERHLVGTGRLSDGVNADGMDAAAIEQFAGGREDALARRRAVALPTGSRSCG